MPLTNEQLQTIFDECLSTYGVRPGCGDRVDTFRDGQRIALEHIAARVTLDEVKDDGTPQEKD